MLNIQQNEFRKFTNFMWKTRFLIPHVDKKWNSLNVNMLKTHFQCKSVKDTMSTCEKSLCLHLKLKPWIWDKKHEFIMFITFFTLIIWVEQKRDESQTFQIIFENRGKSTYFRLKTINFLFQFCLFISKINQALQNIKNKIWTFCSRSAFHLKCLFSGYKSLIKS